MESRLLTDGAIYKAALPYADDTDDFFVMEADRQIAQAQDAKTHRIDCEELAKWYGGDCSDESHENRPQGRISCFHCKVILLASLNKGRMPWEKEQAANKTCRNCKDNSVCSNPERLVWEGNKGCERWTDK